MSEVRVASRYAKSLIGLAQEKGALEAVHQDMQLFAGICEENIDFRIMLRNPIINHEKKLNILQGLFDGRVHQITSSFFEIITRKNRESVLYAIAQEVHKQYNALKGVEMAEIKTTFALDDELRREFKSVIAKATGMNGVELKEEVDKELIGGYVLRVGGQQIDDSLKGKLKELKLKFSHNPYLKGF